MTTPIDFFEAHLGAEDKRPATVRQYGDLLHRFELYLQENYRLSLTSNDLPHITGMHLSAYLQHLAHDREISTRNNYIVILKRFFGYMLSIGAIRQDPSLVLHCIREKTTPQTIERSAGKRYSTEDVKLLLQEILGARPRRTDLRDAAIVALILGSGLRAFEVCALNVSQMEQIRSGTLFCLRKGGSWAHVSVAGFVPGYIEPYLQSRGPVGPDAPLFVSQKGGRLDRKALWSALAAKQSRLELKTGVHIFRHTLLTAVDQNGGSALARDIGGHTSVHVTNRYMHSSMEERLDVLNSTELARSLAVSSK